MRTLLFSAGLLALISCSQSDEREPEKRSATSGDLIVSVTREYTDLVDSLAKEFARQYPEIRPSVDGAQTREAVVRLLNDSLSTICIDREFNEEEQRVMREAEMNFTATRIAWDALVAIVNTANKVERFTRQQLSGIVTGRIGAWDGVPDSRRTGDIEFVTTERNTGLYENTLTMLGGEGEDLKVFAVGASQEECVVYVGQNSDAISLVSLRAVRNLPSSVRIVPLEVLVDTAANRFMDIMPSQTTVYTGEYGLRHGLFLMTTERRSLTGSGFSTFLLTTHAQKLVQKTGLLPAVIPTRVIQLSPE